MSSAKKLQEAEFFIELLHALEERSEPLTNADDPEAEASFLYAAILNAFYSTVQIMRKEGFNTRDFEAKHPSIYADGSRGGERAKTVHISHIEPAHSGYEAPRGNQVNFRFRRSPRLAPLPQQISGRVDLVFKKNYYFHVALEGRNVHALSFCEEHLNELRQYHRSMHVS